MRNLASEIVAQLAARNGIKPRGLVWIEARNRETGEIETVGFWNGDDHQVFIVEGEERTYYGAGNITNLGDLLHEATLNIRNWSCDFTHVSTEVALALRGYDTKGAPVEVHTVFFSTETNNALAAPVRMFKGWVNKLKINTPPQGGVGSAKMDCVGHTRLLTKRLGAKRSNENQKLRSATDLFYRDVGMTGTISTPWGSKGV